MRNNLRQYRAIRVTLTQGYPVEPQGQCARHLTTLAASIRGIVASKRTPLPHIAANEGTEIWKYCLLCAQTSGTISTQVARGL